MASRVPTSPVPRPAFPAGPLSRTTRDLTVLVAVMLILAVLVKVGTGVEYAVPVSLGNATITNADEVVTDAEAAFEQWVDAQATRVSDDAACYFFRPLGPTQGAVAAGMFPAGLLPGLEDAEALDLLLCGPVELATDAVDALPGAASQPWLTGLVAYVDDGTSAGSYRGEFQSMLQSSLAVLTAATGGVKSDQLVRADGHHPDPGVIDQPDWREVTPTGEAPPGGVTLPGGDDLPPVTLPELPPGVTVPPDMTVPELPGMTIPELPPGVTVPPDVTLPGLPGMTVPELPGDSGG